MEEERIGLIARNTFHGIGGSPASRVLIILPFRRSSCDQYLPPTVCFNSQEPRELWGGCARAGKNQRTKSRLFDSRPALRMTGLGDVRSDLCLNTECIAVTTPNVHLQMGQIRIAHNVCLHALQACIQDWSRCLHQVHATSYQPPNTSTFP